MRNFQPARRRVEVSVGESVRVMRELQEMSQNDLARATGIPQSTISAIENEIAICCESGDASQLKRLNQTYEKIQKDLASAEAELDQQTIQAQSA